MAYTWHFTECSLATANSTQVKEPYQKRMEAEIAEGAILEGTKKILIMSTVLVVDGGVVKERVNTHTEVCYDLLADQ